MILEPEIIEVYHTVPPGQENLGKVAAIIISSIRSVLGLQSFSEQHLDAWSYNIRRKVIFGLKGFLPVYKFMVLCHIMKNNENQFGTVMRSEREIPPNGSCCITWQNPTLYCECTAYLIAYE